MKKLIKNYAVIMSLLLIVISCEKDPELNGKNLDVIGEWTWFESFGGFAGDDVQNPEQSGVQKTVKFHNNDTVEIFENGTLIHKTDYFLSEEESLLLHDTFDFLTINYEYRIANTDSLVTLSMRYRINSLSDTLIMEEDVYDGYRHLYRKSDE